MMDIGPQPDDIFHQQHLQNQLNVIQDVEDDYLCDDAWDTFAETILNQAYKPTTPEEVARQQTHLVPER